MTELEIKDGKIKPVKKVFYRSLYFQVLTAIALGVLLGHFYPSLGVAMKPFGDGFIKLIKMLIGPIIFCTIVSGIAGMDNLKQLGSVGIKSLIFFWVLTTLALIIGLVVAHVFQPGAGMNVDPSKIDTASLATYTKGAAEAGSVPDFFLGLIPTSPTSAFAEGNILQILLFSVLFAVVLARLGERGRPVMTFINDLSKVFFGMINIIMKAAPIGAFGAMAFTIGKYGLASLGPLLELMLCFYATCILFVVIGLGVAMRACGLRVWPLLKYIREELFIVLGTSSSESVLPRMIEKMSQLGCSKPVSGLVIPMGYSFNLAGTAIYLTLAALFITQATNTPLSFTQEATLLGVMLLTSKGAAGVTGSGFIVLAATISSIGHIPIAGLALILGIDRFMSEARAITNLIGNAVSTVVIARWENELDMDQARAVLADA